MVPSLIHQPCFNDMQTRENTHIKLQQAANEALDCRIDQQITQLQKQYTHLSDQEQRNFTIRQENERKKLLINGAQAILAEIPSIISRIEDDKNFHPLKQPEQSQTHRSNQHQKLNETKTSLIALLAALDRDLEQNFSESDLEGSDKEGEMMNEEIFYSSEDDIEVKFNL